jgi:acyl carrier protein
MQRAGLKRKIKHLLVAELNLRGRDADAIPDDAALFGTDGLGLDSLDALQIAMLVEENFHVRVPEGDEARPIFRSVSSLAEFIEGAAGAAGATPDRT